MIHLNGMTWDHSRGYDPMVATAAEFVRAHPKVTIGWERRSLQAFADHPVQDLADRYDLIVIDHPHAGAVSRRGCLIALDTLGRDEELALLARQSVGPSHQSYRFDGRQWALAIDAATPVASYRPDLIPARELPRTWEQVRALAERGQVLWPLKPVDALMSFFSLAAHRNTPCGADGDQPLIARSDAQAVLELMASIARLLPPECLSMNPIEVYERMSAETEKRFGYCPLGYGYTNYSRKGYRDRPLTFADMPVIRLGDPPRGSCLGGTGLAISTRCAHVEWAAEYAFWAASAACQKSVYFNSGGQPANAAAWDDDRCNALSHDFFRNTRQTLEHSYLRPRYDGYMRFQDQGGEIINAFLRTRFSLSNTLDRLEQAYRESIRAKE